MYPRCYKPLKDKSFFLFGPRGSGKTTWLRTQFPKADWIDLLDSEVYRQLMASPNRMEGILSPNPEWIVIDEVQKIPALLDEVHRLIESRKWRFVLTGSSARKLKRGAANLLAGRAIQKFFYPLTLWELGKDFRLDHALKYGMLPAVWVENDPKKFLSTYIYTYLKEEVQAEAMTRSIPAFSRFLEVMSYSQAMTTNMNSIARDVGVDSKVIASYLEILEDLLLGIRIPVFRRRAKRKLASHPKFLYFDPGIYRTLKPKGPFDSESELDGPALETLFFHHYRALGAFSDWEQELFYWKSSEKLEVDFVSYGPLGLFAFEIKRSAVLRDEDLTAARAFKADYSVAKVFLFYGGKRREMRDHIEVINYEEGLRLLPELMGCKALDLL